MKKLFLFMLAITLVASYAYAGSDTTKGRNRTWQQVEEVKKQEVKASSEKKEAATGVEKANKGATDQGTIKRTKKEPGASSKKFDSPQVVTNNEKVSDGTGKNLDKKLQDLLTPNPMDPAGQVDSASSVVLGPDGKPIDPAQSQSTAPQASMGGDAHK